MPEERIKFALRMSPATQKLVKDLCPRDNCASQNEFIEKAIHFYAGFVSAKDSTQFLSRTLSSTLRGMLDDTENRVARLLFKLSVEISIMMNVVASRAGIDENMLRKLRNKCVDDVKKSIGTVNFDEAVRFQQRRDT